VPDHGRAEFLAGKQHAADQVQVKAGPPIREGDLFKTFMVGYFAFRLLVDFLKPGLALAGLTAIQWATVAMLIYYGADLPYLLRLREAESS